MLRKNKKGQLSLSDAPSVVLIVGLVFLIMATVALVGTEFNDAIPSDESGVALAEAVTIDADGVRLAGANAENAEGFVITGLTNVTDTQSTEAVAVSDTGVLTNVSLNTAVTGTALTVNYTYSYAGVAANVSTDLTTEISNNTSIAGIVLTISLVGIVLTVLISIFVGFRNRRL